MNRQTQSEANTAETATIAEIGRFRLSLPRWHGGRNVKKKIATLLVTVAMAGALFAGSASAQDHFYHHDAHWWSIHRPAYGYLPAFGYGPGYAYRPVGHWQLIGGHWHWIR
jgi:hypothetical protein